MHCSNAYYVQTAIVRQQLPHCICCIQQAAPTTGTSLVKSSQLAHIPSLARRVMTYLVCLLRLTTQLICLDRLSYFESDYDQISEHRHDDILTTTWLAINSHNFEYPLLCNSHCQQFGRPAGRSFAAFNNSIDTAPF